MINHNNVTSYENILVITQDKQAYMLRNNIEKKNFNIYFNSSLYFPTNWTKVKKRPNLDVIIFA